MKAAARLSITFVWVMGVFFLGVIELQSQGAAALSGIVSSQEEGQMEGVLVSAKREGGTITVSVVSDNQGRYSFPGNRLQPGDYSIKTRAPGYDLDNPGVVKIEANKTAQINLRLQKTANLAAQMTPADWILSKPEIKERLIDGIKYGQNCIGCHSLTPILTSKYPADAWPAILTRMFQHHSASLFERGEVAVVVDHPHKIKRLKPNGECCIDYEELGRFISSINLSSRPDGTWPFELKTMPRPKGRGTKVILTEYQVPRRTAQPHDVIVDAKGMVWYNDHGNQYISRLNPKTGEIQEWLVPGVTADKAKGRSSGRPALDREGNLWFGNVKVDIETTALTVGKGRTAADGGVWRERGSEQADGDPRVSELIRLDPSTDQTRVYPGPNRPMSFYGSEVDSQGNFYGASLDYGVVGVMNGKSGEWAFVPAPSTTKNGTSAGPRRTTLDGQERFWYAQYYSGGIGMFDPKAWQIKEWPIHPYALPYGIGVAKSGEAWAAGQGTDYVYRLNPSTGDVTTYWKGSVVYGQSRHLYVDSSTTPATVWIGHDHMASVVRIEPLD